MTDHAALLRTAEDELAQARRFRAQVATFIHDAAHDRDTRIALATAIGLPGPAKEHTPWEAPASNGRRTSGTQLPAATASPTGAQTATP